MDCSCTGIGGLEASLKLNYVLVVPVKQAVMLKDELLARGVLEQQIYVVNPNRRPPPYSKATNDRTAADTGGEGGGRRRDRTKRFMPGAIKLGTYVAGGRLYTVGLRWGSLWISMVDRPPVANSEGASEVTVAYGGGASEVTVAGNDAIAAIPPAMDRRIPAAVPVPEEDDGVVARVPKEGGGGGPEADTKRTVAREGDCDDNGDYDDNDNDNNDNDNNDDVDPNLGNDGRCNSSSTLCEDCKRWLFREYFGDRCHDDKASDLTAGHACIYKRIVDRLFVVTVTESGGGGGEVGNDDEAAFCCGTTTAADCTTSEVASPPERDQPVAGPSGRDQPVVGPTTSVSQHAPETENATTPAEAANVGKPKSKSFFGKLCSKSRKKTKDLKPPKTN